MQLLGQFGLAVSGTNTCLVLESAATECAPSAVGTFSSHSFVLASMTPSTAPPAHYFGVPAVGVRSADALEKAVRTALAAAGPTVIEAVVDSEHYLETVYD